MNSLGFQWIPYFFTIYTERVLKSMLFPLFPQTFLTTPHPFPRFWVFEKIRPIPVPHQFKKPFLLDIQKISNYFHKETVVIAVHLESWRVAKLKVKWCKRNQLVDTGSISYAAALIHWKLNDLERIEKLGNFFTCMGNYFFVFWETIKLYETFLWREYSYLEVMSHVCDVVYFHQ